MIQVAPNRSQNGLIALAALVIVLVVFLAAYRPLPSEPVSTAGPSHVAVATGPASPGPHATRSFLPVPTLKPNPTQGPCTLSESLPTGGDSAATPAVEGSAGSMVFASPVYRASAGAPIAADDPLADWEMGLWFVAAPGAEPVLKLAAGKGMVLPLALSSDGRSAAVWWWPERRGSGEVRCTSGIYALSLTGPGSRLIVAGDWAAPEEDGVEWSWGDPTDHLSSSLRFRLPRAGFSADGSYLAIVDGDVIDVYRTAFPDRPIHHVGACPQWAWAPVEARFVAACEDMTSAWIVRPSCCDGELGARSMPIPSPPPGEGFLEDWEQSSSRAIGFTADGDIRITRAYGFATGCEGPDPCHIPPPAWGMTTIDGETSKAVHELHETDFLFDFEARLSADASWLYGHSYGAGDVEGVTIELASGVVRRAPLLGNVAGAAPDGSAIFGWLDEEAPAVVLRALTPRSATNVVTISWPDAAVTHSMRIPVFGLVVGRALT